jgi:hypothetical protein
VKKTNQCFVRFWIFLAKIFGCRKSATPESYVELSLLAGEAVSNVFSEVGNGLQTVMEANTESMRRQFRETAVHSLDIRETECTKIVVEKRSCFSHQ